jgi:MFS transporter, MHS family, shikimate and dehydroshikimate transport protein
LSSSVEVGLAVANDHGQSVAAGAPIEKSVTLRPNRWVLASTVFGSIIEWYDFYIYGTAAALVFGRLFFPASDPNVSTLAAFVTFAIGLFARPLGGIIFGHFGDRIGRKSMLLISLVMMGVPTVLIGVLPTYQSIGYWAPLSLVVLRVVQGLALGGEFGGAVLMAVEHSSQTTRSIFGSLPQLGVPGGVLLSTGAFALVSRMGEADFLAWGWRIPFLAGAILVIFGIFVRLRIAETPDFETARAQGRIESLPVVALLRRRLVAVLLLSGGKLGEVTLFFLTTVYLVSYTTGRLGLPRDFVLTSIVIAAAVCFINIPVAGWLGDRFGQKLIYGTGAILLMIAAVPMFLLLESRDHTLVMIAFVFPLGFIFPLMFGPQPSLYAAQFPPELRYSGISLGVALASATGGGLAPVIATGLVGSWGSSVAIGYYMAGMAAISAVSVLFMKRA